MKKWNISCGLILGLLLIGSISACNEVSDNRQAIVSPSPDSTYIVKVYKATSYFSMPGQGSDLFAIIEVKDAKGRLVAKVDDSNPDCAILWDDVQLEWDMHNKYLYFGKARILDLNTGKCL